MAGGTWNTQNKTRPGVYIRFKSAEASSFNTGERGVVTICEPLSWGPTGQVMEIAAGADTTPFTGYPLAAPQNRFLTEIFKGSGRTNGPNKVLLYRPTASGAVQAAATIGRLTATAKYFGVRGNDISVSVSALVEPETGFRVTTAVDGEVVDQQTVQAVSGLVENDWVTFSGDGALEANTGVPLTGGADGTVQSAAYSTYLSVIEPYKFDIMIYDGTDSTVQAAMTAFIRRIAEENGQYAQLVAAELTDPDSQYVINVCSGAMLADGTILTPQRATWWVGGAQAGARYNESLTYANYPGAVSAYPMMTNSQYIDALMAGRFVLFGENGAVKVEQDIDSLVTFTQDVGKAFRKNRVMRLLSTIANDIHAQFSENFIGVVNNNEAGRSRFKAVIVGYLLDIQANEGIHDFSADDVEVLPGSDVDSIVVNIALHVVDAVEKIYLTVEVS